MKITEKGKWYSLIAGGSAVGSIVSSVFAGDGFSGFIMAMFSICLLLSSGLIASMILDEIIFDEHPETNEE